MKKLTQRCIIISLLSCLPFLSFASTDLHIPFAPNYVTPNTSYEIQKLYVHNDTNDWTAVGIDAPTGFVMCSGRAGHWTGPGRHDDTVYWSGFFSIEKMCNKTFPCTAKVYMSSPNDPSAKNCDGAPKSIATLYSTGYASFAPENFTIGSEHVSIHNPSQYHFNVSH